MVGYVKRSLIDATMRKVDCLKLIGTSRWRKKSKKTWIERNLI